ncbi:MAG: hypothetical protein Q9219_004799 [cf. Caloplaca sp. 3 TL-2023]
MTCPFHQIKEPVSNGLQLPAASNSPTTSFCSSDKGQETTQVLDYPTSRPSHEGRQGSAPGACLSDPSKKLDCHPEGFLPKSPSTIITAPSQQTNSACEEASVSNQLTYDNFGLCKPTGGASAQQDRSEKLAKPDKRDKRRRQSDNSLLRPRSNPIRIINEINAFCEGKSKQPRFMLTAAWGEHIEIRDTGARSYELYTGEAPEADGSLRLAPEPYTLPFIVLEISKSQRDDNIDAKVRKWTEDAHGKIACVFQLKLRAIPNTSNARVLASVIYPEPGISANGHKVVHQRRIFNDVEIYPDSSNLDFTLVLDKILKKDHDRTTIPPSILYQPVVIPLRTIRQTAREAVEEFKINPSLSASSSGYSFHSSKSTPDDESKDPTYHP